MRYADRKEKTLSVMQVQIARGVRKDTLTADEVAKVKDALLQGMVDLAALSERCGICAVAVLKELKTNPELAKLYEAAREARIQLVEDAGFNLAMGARNEIAQEKMIEYMTKYNMPERYTENAITSKMGSDVRPKIVLPVVLPVVKVNSEGIPVKDDTVVDV